MLGVGNPNVAAGGSAAAGAAVAVACGVTVAAAVCGVTVAAATFCAALPAGVALFWASTRAWLAAAFSVVVFGGAVNGASAEAIAEEAK